MATDSDVTLPANAPHFIMTRQFAAPRALIFHCFIDSGHLSRWWGPRGMTCTACEVDAKEGGSYLIAIRAPDGKDYRLRGIFQAIETDRRIVKSDDVSDHPEEWFDIVDPARKGQGKRHIGMTTTFTFEDHDGGTRLLIDTEFDTLALRDGFVGVGFAQGWRSSLDRLEDLTNAIKDDPHQINIVRVLKHPVERVFAAFSNPAGMASWWGPNGFTTTTRSMQFKEGGTWDYTMHGPDGTDYPNYVSYTRIEKNRLIAYDHGTDAEHLALFKAEIHFEPVAEGTRVLLRLTLPDASLRPRYVAFGAVDGGYQNLERLGAWLDSNS